MAARGLLFVSVPQWKVRPHTEQSRPRGTRRSVLKYLSDRHFNSRGMAVNAAGGNGFSATESPSIDMQQDSKTGEKKIVAEIKVQARLDQVWDVLTNYEALPTFVPNLERCEKLPCSKPGVLLLRQIGCSQSILWRLEAEAVLELEEIEKSSLRKEVKFHMTQGDFEEFYGKWIVESDVSSAAQMSTFLRYEIVIKPKFALPSQVVSYIIRAGLPSNIRAIALRAESLAAERLQAPGLASWVGVEVDPAIPETGGTLDGQIAGNDPPFEPAWPSKGPFWPRGSLYAAAAPITAGIQKKQAAMNAAKSSYLGTTWVPLPPSGKPEKSSVKEVLNEGLQKKSSLLDGYPAFDIGSNPIYREFSMAESRSMGIAWAQNRSGGSLPGDVEIHLRRLDGLDYLHRRSVAAIKVNASPALVWNVVTDYNRLAEFVPNLASSERIRLPTTAPDNVVRVRQVGYKNMFYMCLHAESVMDIVEKPYSEVQFRQVAGDFQTFQGKWIIQEGRPSIEEDYVGPQTLLKYAVEIIIPAGASMCGVIEPLLEGVVFEDMAKNLLAIKTEIERVRQNSKAQPLRDQTKRTRPRLAEMIQDFTVLRRELEENYGDARVIPSRTQLRATNRTDIEKALSAHGGASVVASRIGWKLTGRSRKPKGYWNSIDNFRNEIDDFIISSGLPPQMMPPKNDIVRAGRFDLARAIEKWGGVYNVADELGYGILQANSTSEWQDHVSQTAAETGLSGKQGLFEVASATYKIENRSNDDILSSIDLEDIMDVQTVYEDGPGDTLGKFSSLPSARDEIDAW